MRDDVDCRHTALAGERPCHLLRRRTARLEQHCVDVWPQFCNDSLDIAYSSINEKDF
jgi:hypothetical protein